MVWLGDGNSKESLDAFWPSLSVAQRAGVAAVSMDMWKAYASSTRQHVPHAEIIYDFFHLVRHVNRAVNLVRQKESARLHLADHNPLKGTRQLWLYGMENVPERAKESFKRLWNSNLKTARAWHLKEVFRTFTANQTPEEGRLFLTQWISKATAEPPRSHAPRGTHGAGPPGRHRGLLPPPQWLRRSADLPEVCRRYRSRAQGTARPLNGAGGAPARAQAGARPRAFARSRPQVASLTDLQWTGRSNQGRQKHVTIEMPQKVYAVPSMSRATRDIRRRTIETYKNGKGTQAAIAHSYNMDIRTL